MLGWTAQWIDGVNDAAVTTWGDGSTPTGSLFDAGELWNVTGLENCPGNDSQVVSLLLRCPSWTRIGPYTTVPSIETGTFQGSPTVTIALRRLDGEQLEGPVEPLAIMHLDPDTLLPEAWEMLAGVERITYTHSFLSRNELPPNFFDANANGFGPNPD